MCNIYDRKNKSGGTKKIYSDHNVIILKVDFNDRDAKRKKDMKLEQIKDIESTNIFYNINKLAK